MILDSQQQKNQLLQLLQMVEVTGPFVTAQQQVIQVQDMIQTVAAADIKPPEPVSTPASPITSQPAAPEAQKTGK
jgi:hypothetical protein